VTDMNRMFAGASVFNADLSGWTIQSGAITSGMFSGADAFQLRYDCETNGGTRDDGPPNLCTAEMLRDGWDTGSIRWAMRVCLWNYWTGNLCPSEVVAVYGEMADWDTSKVTDMRELFRDFHMGDSLNANLSAWNTSQVTDMSGMFSMLRSFNADISDWDISKVDDLHGMFDYAHAFNGNVSYWNHRQVTHMT